MSEKGTCSTKKCLFCGRVLSPKRIRGGGKSDEHVVPQWLLRHLAIGAEAIAPTHLDVRTGAVVHARRHRMGNLVVGSVCQGCNNGWLSGLENQAEPLLKDLIADPHRLSTLKKAERRLVARWVFKTAAALNRSSTYGNAEISPSHPVSDRHLQALREGNIPDEVAVLGGGCACNRSFDFFQTDNWSAPEDGFPLQPEDQHLSYKIGLSFRDLLFAVAFFPNAEYHYAVAHRVYYPLWGGARGIVPWRAQMDQSPLLSNSPAIEGFVRSVGVVSRTYCQLRVNHAETQLVVPVGQTNVPSVQLEVAFFDGPD